VGRLCTAHQKEGPKKTKPAEDKVTSGSARIAQQVHGKKKTAFRQGSYQKASAKGLRGKSNQKKKYPNGEVFGESGVLPAEGDAGGNTVQHRGKRAL